MFISHAPGGPKVGALPTCQQVMICFEIPTAGTAKGVQTALAKHLCIQTLPITHQLTEGECSFKHKQPLCFSFKPCSGHDTLKMAQGWGGQMGRLGGPCLLRCSPVTDSGSLRFQARTDPSHTRDLLRIRFSALPQPCSPLVVLGHVPLP